MSESYDRSDLLNALNGLIMLTSSNHLDEAIGHKNVVLDFIDDLVDEVNVSRETIVVQHRLMKSGEQRGYKKALEHFNSEDGI